LVEKLSSKNKSNPFCRHFEFCEDWSKAKVTYLNLPPGCHPERVHKPKAHIFYCSPFAIFLKDLVKIGSAVLETSRAKTDKLKNIYISYGRGH